MRKDYIRVLIYFRSADMLQAVRKAAKSEGKSLSWYLLESAYEKATSKNGG